MTLVEKEGYSQNKMENMDWLNETDQIEGKIRYILLLTIHIRIIMCNYLFLTYICIMYYGK